jgi:hypothetical protein
MKRLGRAETGLREQAKSHPLRPLPAAGLRRETNLAVRHLGPCVVFHMHSTGLQHFRQVLRIPGLAGLQMTIEANSPPLPDLLPVFREILEQSRLLLFLDHRFEELSALLPHLPREGLYLAIPASRLQTEAEFLQFAKAHWPADV